MFAVLLSTMILAADPGPQVTVTSTPRVAASAAVKKTNNAQPLSCWVEKPVGSHIMRTVCATLEDLDKAKRDADDALGARNVGRLGANGSK